MGGIDDTQGHLRFILKVFGLFRTPQTTLTLCLDRSGGFWLQVRNTLPLQPIREDLRFRQCRLVLS